MSSRDPFSPDPNEEGFGGFGNGKNSGLKPTSLKIATSDLPQVLLVTANVGSIFEDPTVLIPQWMDKVVEQLEIQRPKFVAVHCQEIGGKNFQKSMDHVNNFVNQIVSRAEKLGFNRVVAFFDENYHASDKFTALGSIYLVHESLPNVELYNFEAATLQGMVEGISSNRKGKRLSQPPQSPTQSSITSPSQNRTFQSVAQHLLRLGSIDNDVMVEKRKFPLQYFPDCRWSRKGFLRTRWRVGVEPMSSTFDLVNIHLFHDACNLKSVESEGPSVYVNYRQRALQYTLDYIAGDNADHNPLPFFIFGDFNFRLNCRSVVDALDAELRVKHDDEDEDVDANADDSNGGFTRKCMSSAESNDVDSDLSSAVDGRIILSIGKKEFDLGRRHHDKTFLADWRRWTPFDMETNSVLDRVSEFPLNFPPTYPFEESVHEGSSYMKTRCPAWCDRVLMSHEAAKSLVYRQAEQPINGVVGDVTYDIIGRDVCMGDHKPVFLSFKLAIDSHAVQQRVDGDVGREHPPSIESPSYTDLLDNNCSRRYLDLADANAMKMFKETTV